MRFGARPLESSVVNLDGEKPLAKLDRGQAVLVRRGALGSDPYARPGTASGSSRRPRASHQLTSAPKTIAFAIT